jgi:tellurite resistance protein TehA-like permease
MGTGMVSILLFAIPYKTATLYYASIFFFSLNALIFIAAFIVSALRYTLYPEIWSVMIRDPVNSLFLATIPIGFATLIEMWIFVCVPKWGEWALTLAWVMWMLNTIVSFSITITLPVML